MAPSVHAAWPAITLEQLAQRLGAGSTRGSRKGGSSTATNRHRRRLTWAAATQGTAGRRLTKERGGECKAQGQGRPGVHPTGEGQVLQARQQAADRATPPKVRGARHSAAASVHHWRCLRARRAPAAFGGRDRPHSCAPPWRPPQRRPGRRDAAPRPRCRPPAAPEGPGLRGMVQGGEGRRLTARARSGGGSPRTSKHRTGVLRASMAVGEVAMSLCPPVCLPRQAGDC